MSRRFRTARYAVLLALTLTVAACSGDGDNKAAPTPVASSAENVISLPVPLPGASSPSGALAGAGAAVSEAVVAAGGCEKAAADKAAKAITTVVGGPPMVTKVEISTGCLEAKIATSLPAAGGAAAVKLCEQAAAIAYPLGVLGISVSSIEDKLLATSIRGDASCNQEN